MAFEHLAYDHLEDDYIDIEVTSYFPHSMMASPPHPSEFEFQMSSSTSLELLEPSTTSPADELFYKGNLLPLHLPPRLQMVEKLLQNSTCCFDHKPKDRYEEFYSTPLCTTVTTTPTSVSTPFESCNISPVESCQVSRELNHDEYILEYANEGFRSSKKSWTKKLREYSSLGSKLKASRAYLKSLFGKTGCSNESSALAAAKIAHEGTVMKSEDLSKYAKMGKKNELGEIHQKEKYRSFNKEKITENGSSLHRKSFSLATQRHSTKNDSSPSSSSSSSSSSDSSSSSSCSNYSKGSEVAPKFLKRCNSANSEMESSIQGAIAHCKQSQQALRSRKTASEVVFHYVPTSMKL